MITETERLEVEKVIHNAIGLALNKKIERLFSIMAKNDDFFIFHPDSKSTIIGFEAFKKLGERVWVKDAFNATDFAVKDLRLKFAEMGNVAWYSCMLDDHAEKTNDEMWEVIGGSINQNNQQRVEFLCKPIS